MATAEPVPSSAEAQRPPEKTSPSPPPPPPPPDSSSDAAPATMEVQQQAQQKQPTPPQETSVVTSLGNFDVVLVADPETGILNLWNDQQHIGNTRFQVTLDMHRHDFGARHERGQDTSPIVHKLVAIVTEQCVPPGRFLQPKATDDKDNKDDKNKSWTHVPQNLVVEFIERSLMPNANANNKATTNHNKKEQEKSPNNRRRVSFADTMMLATESSTNNDSSHNDDSDDDQARLLAFAKKQQQQKMKLQEEEKKRRRRSSLLRRSLSDHLMPVAREVEDKKKMNRTTEERRPSLWRALFQHKIVKHPDSLDIVLVFLGATSGGGGGPDIGKAPPEAADLVPNHTGNNRLRVMMQMNKDKYAAASIDEQAAMCQEWIHTVTTYWKGRFLRHDNVLEQYEVLETGQVEMALDKVMIRMIEGDHDAHWSGVEHGGLSALWEGSKEFDQGSSNSFVPNNAQSSTEFQMGSGSSRSASAEFAKGSRSAEFISRPRFGRGRKARQTSDISVASAPVLPSAQVSSGNNNDHSLRRSMKAFLPNFKRASSGSAMHNPEMQRRQSNLPEPPANILSEEHVQAQRSAAVESLQRRKKRQGLASRIQKMAQNSFMRASMSSKSSQSASETQQAAQQVQNMMMERRTSHMSTNSSASAMSMSVTSSSFSAPPPPPTTIYSHNSNGISGFGSSGTSARPSASATTVSSVSTAMDLSSSIRRTSNSSVSTSGSSLMPEAQRMPDLDHDTKLPPTSVFTQPPVPKNPPPNSSSAPSPIPSSARAAGPSPVPSAAATKPAGTNLAETKVAAATNDSKTAIPVLPNVELKEEKKSGEVPTLDNLLIDELLPSPRSSLNKNNSLNLDDEEVVEAETKEASSKKEDSADKTTTNNNHHHEKTKREERNEGLSASDIIQQDMLPSPRSSLKKDDPVVDYEGESPVVDPSASL